VLKPTDPRARVVGQAITVLNRVVEPGDVLVVQGVPQISSLGGISACLLRARRTCCATACRWRSS